MCVSRIISFRTGLKMAFHELFDSERDLKCAFRELFDSERDLKWRFTNYLIQNGT